MLQNIYSEIDYVKEINIFRLSNIVLNIRNKLIIINKYNINLYI